MIVDSHLATQQDSRTPAEAENDEYAMQRQNSTDVHRWATAAISAHAPSSSSSPVERRSPSSSRHRRDSAGISTWSTKSSAPPTLDNDVGTLSTRDEEEGCNYSSLKESSRSPTRQTQRFLAEEVLKQRPASMFAASLSSPFSSEHFHFPQGAEARAAEESLSQRHLKSCLKGIPAETIPVADGQEQPTSASSRTNTFAGSSHSHSKSVQISDKLPRHRVSQRSSLSSMSALSGTSSPSHTRLLSITHQHRRQASDARGSDSIDERSFRHHPSSQSSPTLTTSTTYESEEDIPVLMTPMDENGPHYATEEMTQKGFQAQRKTESLRILTDLRRKHQHTATSAHASSVPSAEDERTESSPESVDEISSAAPVLSHNTLIDIGLTKGTTPPVTRGITSVSETGPKAISAAPCNIVSTGLEMGLGLGMTSSALRQQLATAQSSTISNSMPRFQRPGAPNSINMSDLANSLRLTEKELPNSPVSYPTYRSEEVDKGVTREAVEHEEAELARRRTTGGLRREQGKPVGKRRPQRFSTQDTAVERPVGRPRQASDGRRPLPNQQAEDRSGSHRTSPVFEAMALHPATSPLHTPSHENSGLISPAHLRPSAVVSNASSACDHDCLGYGREHGDDRPLYKQALLGPQIVSVSNLEGGFMGIGESGHFGPGVRAKVSEVMELFMDSVPLTGEEGEAVTVVEYGTMNSRSGLLFRSVISSLSRRAHELCRRSAASDEEIAQPSDYFGNVHKNSEDSTASFTIVHEDSTVNDFRPMMVMMETHNDSYLNTQWQASHYPNLSNAVFSNFTMRPFASRIAPPRTVQVGMSLMDLHWLRSPACTGQTRSAKADSELTSFLKTRAHEFEKDGLLFMAYIARGNEPDDPDSIPSIGTSPISGARGSSVPDRFMSGNTHSRSSSLHVSRDIWTTLGNTLSPCIQRLVSCGMLKSDVARHLLDLPMYPRSASQTKAALMSVDKQWKLEWSCGLGKSDIVASTAGTGRELRNEPEPLRLAHPAWKTYQSGCLASNPFTEHMIQLFKNLYEAHFRSVLREKGKLSKGAVEFVLDSLWDALFSRIADREPNPISNVEIEVCIYALRRR